MKQLLLIIIFSFSYHSHSQVFQTGITFGTNFTYPVKGKSVYDNKYFKPVGVFGLNIAIPLHFKINDIWTVKSGVDFQNKTYQIKLIKPAFPLLESKGGFHFSARFNIIQIPLILSFKKPKQNFEFDMGILFSRNQPSVLGSEINWTPIYSGNDTLTYNYKSIHNNDFNPFNSVDVHFGVEYGFKKDGIKKHALKLAIEFNNFSSNQYYMEMNLENSELPQAYESTISPKLASLKLTYTNFIEWDIKRKN